MSRRSIDTSETVVPLVPLARHAVPDATDPLDSAGSMWPQRGTIFPRLDRIQQLHAGGAIAISDRRRPTK
jgi:hypothetical protein